MCKRLCVYVHVFICACVWECVWICVVVFLWMCVCLWMCMWVYVWYICMHMCTSDESVCEFLCLCVWICVCMYVYECVCECVCECVWMCACMWVSLWMCHCECVCQGGSLHDYLSSLSPEVHQHLAVVFFISAGSPGHMWCKVLQAELDESGFKCQPCFLQALWPYTSHLTALYCSFLSCKMQIILLHRTGERKQQGLSCGYIIQSSFTLLLKFSFKAVLRWGWGAWGWH